MRAASPDQAIVALEAGLDNFLRPVFCFNISIVTWRGAKGVYTGHDAALVAEVEAPADGAGGGGCR
jgi:hypothetical protein